MSHTLTVSDATLKVILTALDYCSSEAADDNLPDQGCSADDYDAAADAVRAQTVGQQS